MQNQTRWAFGSALAALALSGCNNSQPPATTTVTTPPAVVTTAPGADTTSVTSGVPGAPDTKINNNAGPGTSNGTDQATADAINTAIVHNKEMTGSRVDAVVTGGVARLTGTVQNQQQKGLAASAASKTPGVTSVVNKLLIDATGGIHSASAVPKTKIINHTTVINHYISEPSSPGSGTGIGGGSNTPDSNGGAGASDGGNGSGTGTTGDGTNGNATATQPTAPRAVRRAVGEDTSPPTPLLPRLCLRHYYGSVIGVKARGGREGIGEEDAGLS